MAEVILKKCRKCGALVQVGLCPLCKSEYDRERRKTWRLQDPEGMWAYESVKDSRKRSKKKCIPHSITVPWVLKQLREQKRDCYYCGEFLDFRPKDPFHPRAPTLDQVNPSAGYTEDNIVVACWECNRAKNNSNLELLEGLVRGMRRFFGLDH